MKLFKYVHKNPGAEYDRHPAFYSRNNKTVVSLHNQLLK